MMVIVNYTYIYINITITKISCQVSLAEGDLDGHFKGRLGPPQVPCNEFQLTPFGAPFCTSLGAGKIGRGELQSEWPICRFRWQKPSTTTYIEYQ